MGHFLKLYNPNYKEKDKNKIQKIFGWTNSWSDVHDYWNEIDEGYLTPSQFVIYNDLLKIYKDELTSDEIWSMTNSNEIKGGI